MRTMPGMVMTVTGGGDSGGGVFVTVRRVMWPVSQP